MLTDYVSSLHSVPTQLINDCIDVYHVPKSLPASVLLYAQQPPYGTVFLLTLSIYHFTNQVKRRSGSVNY